MENRIQAKDSPWFPYNFIDHADVVIGAEASNVINVGLTVKDTDYKTLTEPGVFDMYFSDDADGSSLSATAITTVAIGSNGLIIGTITTGKAFKVKTNAAGLIDLNLTYAVGAKTWYLVIRKSDDRIVVVGPITFA